MDPNLLGDLAREKLRLSGALLTELNWVSPNRPLGPELGEVLAAGYLRGADLWHPACALYVSTAPADNVLTLDQRQRLVAGTLGCRV